MSLISYKITALREDDDSSGKNIVPFATVEVRTAAGAIAPIFSNSTGTTLSNPFITDSKGEAKFWIEPGQYLISVAGGAQWPIYISSATTNDFTDEQKEYLESLPSEFDKKEDKVSKKNNLNSPNSSDYPTTLAVAEAIANINKGQNYKGLWNSLTNTPTIVSSTGIQGDWYEVSVASSDTTTIDGIAVWPVGAKIVFNGSIWEKQITPGVQSVNGKTGNVVEKFANRSALSSALAAGSLSVGDVVETKGCDAVGDGGHAPFDIVASTSLPVDGYGVIGSGPYAVLRTDNGVVCPEQFGAAAGGDETLACQRALDFQGAKALLLKRLYKHTDTLRVYRDGYSVVGLGWHTGFTSDEDFGDSLVIESPDPDASSILKVNIGNFEINRLALATSGALLRVNEAAYCTIKSMSLQNGFIGFQGQGLRACFIDIMHIRAGLYFGSIQAGSRFAVIEDSTSGLSFAETTEPFISNLNCTTNTSNAYVEHGIEVKECDGIWFDGGHVRGAAYSNCLINGASSPQLSGVKFDNFWFDGLTERCLLISGTPTGYMGFLAFNDCSFTGGSIRAIETQLGAVLDWVEFNSCNIWSINSQVAVRFDSGSNIHISNLNMKALNASNAPSSSAIVVGAAVNTININGGNLFNSPNIANGIFINDGVVSATVNCFGFKGLGASAKPINIQNPYTLKYQSSGCNTDQSHRYVAGNMQSGRFNSVADDTAVSVFIGEILGGVMSVAITLNTTASGIIALETLDPSTIAIVAGGANLAVTTGVLTGTTGTDGRLTVSVTDDGTLYFENRTGVARSIIWRFIDRDL